MIFLGAFFTVLEPASSVGVSIPSTVSTKIDPTLQTAFLKPKVAKLAYTKKGFQLQDYLSFFSKSQSEILLIIYGTNPRLVSNPEVLKLVWELRGGDLNGITGARTVMAMVILLFSSLIEPTFINSGPIRPDRPFVGPGTYADPPIYPSIFGWFAPNPSSSRSPSTVLEIDRPSAVPHQDFVKLTPQERRALPDSRDMRIICNGNPQLKIGYWQAQYKLKDYGAVHGLSFEVKNNGGTKTERTEANTLAMMRSIQDMPNRNNVEWFEDGTYQGGTNREFNAIHLYDHETRVIAVFNKSTGKFVTTCQLKLTEHQELLETGNFGGGKGRFSGQVNNLPPQTPTSSFENDVMGITPINESEFDNP